MIAHAGGNAVAPANTMYALHTAMEIGADVLDLDLRMTADGVIVARHDRDLATTTNGSGPVDEANWAEVEQLDAAANWSGEPIENAVGVLRLDDALAGFPDTLFSLEIKQTAPSLAGPLCDVLRAADSIERVFVAANDDDALYSFQDTCGEALITTTFRDLDDRQAADLRGEVWCSASPIDQPPYRNVPNFAAYVQRSHERGAAVFAWTVNDPDDLRTLAEAGVDAVYTDRPDLAREIFDDFASSA